MHLKVLWIGRTKSEPLRFLLEDYLGRIEHLCSCEIVEVVDVARRRSLRDGELLRAEAAEISKNYTKGYRRVVLDGKGKELTSTEFARWLEQEQVRGTRGVEFIIGGAEGLSRRILDDAHLKLALSRMTWTHDMCRVLLLEQIYRALCIIKRIPYHK
jgi:23S rRNA (pseudouridine1915-N3)-methyltransferase